MNTNLKKHKPASSEIKSGLFSKREGAEAVATGIHHLHSSLLGVNDPCWKVTESRLKGSSLNYPWELSNLTNGITLRESNQRSDCYQTIISTTTFGQKSQNRDRLNLILEELLSNAFYHSYKNQNQVDKYDRLKPVTLGSGEEIRIFFRDNSEGLHLVIEDQGGSLSFRDFSSCFSRCFQQTDNHIAFEDKHTGAGLGLFLVFEIVSHMTVQVTKNKKTRISLWLSNTNQYDPDSFSFNFFEE